jgi:hypothetical protein
VTEGRESESGGGARTGELNGGLAWRMDGVERRTDRLYREHFGEGDYTGTREQLQELRKALATHIAEYRQDKQMERAERQEEREARNRAMETLSLSVLTATQSMESRRPSGLYLALAIIVTIAIVWSVLPKG